MVDITLDFTGGKNIKLENHDDLVATAQIKPMSTQVIAVIRAYDVTWSTPCKIKMAKCYNWALTADEIAERTRAAPER